MREIITAYTLAQQPCVLYHTSGMISLGVGEELRYTLSESRWCVGFDQPDGDKGSCPDDALAELGAQCRCCSQRTQLEVCMRCNGSRCINAARRARCVFADHYVYLAFYSDQLIKVGVTKMDRFQTRIAEQGALGAIAIVSAGGQEARRIEHAINMAGWIDRTDILPLLAAEHAGAGEAEALLRQEAMKIRKRIPGVVWMEEGPFVWSAGRYPPPLRMAPRKLVPGRDPLAGDIYGIRGGYLMLTLPALDGFTERETVACPLRSLPGRELRALGDRFAGPAQGALVFAP